VLSHLFRRNNAVFSSGELVSRWEDDRVQQEGIDGLMFPFGYGDGGGGPAGPVSGGISLPAVGAGCIKPEKTVYTGDNNSGIGGLKP